MFFEPKSVKDGKNYLQALKRLIHYKEDILSPDDLATLRSLKEKLAAALKTRQTGLISEVQCELERAADRIAPPPKHAALSENVEGLLVPLIVILAFMSYFIQPFWIPTGSMQPTFFGVVAESVSHPLPNPFVRAFEYVFLGRNYIDLVAKEDETIVDLKEKTYLSYFTFTTIVGTHGSYTVFAPRTALESIGVQIFRNYRKGEVIARALVNTGDLVLVEKVSYHFVQPRKGDVFVFDTAGIAGIPGNFTQNYVKRIAGTPGDILQVFEPRLFINGEVPKARVFQRVMSQLHGYRGYANLPSPFLSQPGDAFLVPAKAFFALGDNSFDSLDSRFWGAVPEKNVLGRALLVGWPFSKRWGLIQ